jgi:hemerythrin-like domain-containing protein
MLAELLTGQHRACDADFARIEQAAHRGDWSRAKRAAYDFVEHTEAHFAREEDILFPRLLEVAPNAAGPTSVMRQEHLQMRQQFNELLAAVDREDIDELSDVAEGLLMLMQQHNAKEENVLYPIADQTLSADLERLVEALQANV